MNKSSICFKDKTILITGAAGTVGKELTKQILKYQPAEIRLLDNNETKIFFLKEKYENFPFVKCFLGDIREVMSYNSCKKRVA